MFVSKKAGRTAHVLLARLVCCSSFTDWLLAPFVLVVVVCLLIWGGASQGMLILPCSER